MELECFDFALFSFILLYVTDAAVTAVAVAVVADVVAAVAAVAVADVAAAVAVVVLCFSLIQSSDGIYLASNAAQLRRVDGLDHLRTFWARSTGRTWCLLSSFL